MTYIVDIFDEKWKKVKTRDLNDKIFNDDNVNNSLLHEFILMQQSNLRNPIAHVKTRWEVSRSWKKLFRQKWSGRARAWDAKSPIRRWGWQSFWPRNTANFIKDMPKKMRRKALFWALSLKAKDQELLCLNKYSATEIKTKNAVEVLWNLWLGWEKVLFVIPWSNEILIKSFRNIDRVKYVIVDYINPYDLLTYKKVLFIEDSLDKLESIFLN